MIENVKKSLLGAGIVVETMACVVVDYGAPATLIERDRGVKVPLGNINQLRTRYITELEELVFTRITKLTAKV